MKIQRAIYVTAAAVFVGRAARSVWITRRWATLGPVTDRLDLLGHNLSTEIAELNDRLDAIEVRLAANGQPPA